ncbi:hypothetical protein [Mucilaginibacter sp.]|uniref:hypothetical protein n=1 Tax=Mucilaginibacter sp. TaxID=1882438 RepID=UPI00262C97F7|nr:hypothetical protein [Mucilaginibacter sp.]MDB4921311.1 hypothetical protein [Mucilaginibacter sp.]
MEKDLKKKTVIPFIIFLGFIAISINSLFKGIARHQTWRIVLASVGGLFFIVLAVMLVYTVLKYKKGDTKEIS